MTNSVTPFRRRALVTGASGGIGTSIVRALAASGTHVIVHAHRAMERATALAQKIATAHNVMVYPKE